jgi:hypothetical protein
MLARVCAVGALALFLTIGSVGRAHIDLLSPQPRASGLVNANLDNPPCGQRNPGRIPEKVSVFRPGETITVSWDAYVQHPSYFRLSLDAEGDDSFSERTVPPADPARDDPSRLPQGEGELILDYVRDPAGELALIEHSITLPSEPCEACTLQLIQFIYDVPVDEATYYQCADLTLAGVPVPPAPDEPTLTPAGATGGCALRHPTRAQPALALLAVVASSLCRRRRRRQSMGTR